MYIKKITVRNFKSFNKKIEIPFYRGFTVISGPNGSGKSNIVDSILFCLGLTPSRVLRAERLTDLIYSGNGRQSNEAEVSIAFDNSDGILPAEAEVVITRKIRMTEKGYYSYYYLNGKATNLTEIHKLLSHAGIYSDAYNVIMQGDVTRITEMSPFQRRKIIDDVAGISEFEEKKEKALEELEAVRENIERINTILIEVSSRLEGLEKDRKEALQYKSLLEEKERNQRYILAHRYNSLLLKKKRLENEIKRFEREKDSISSEILGINSKIQELNERADKLTKKISEMADESYREVQDGIVGINSEIEGIRKSQEIYKAELGRLEDERTRLMLSVAKLKEELEGIKAEIEKLLIQKISIQEVVDETEAKIDLIKLKLQEIDVRFQRLRDELLGKKERLERLKDQKSELVRIRDTKLEAIRRIGLEIEELDAEKRELECSKSSMLNQIAAKKEKIDELEKKLEEAIKSRNEIDSELFSLRKELSMVEESIKSKEVELARVKTELSAIESGFSKAVELVLEARERKALPGIYGTVAQLCKVLERYAIALEVAAGNSLQFLVVEDENDAVRAINYLKQIKGGRATFLPLKKLKKFEKLQLDKAILSEKGAIGYAVDLIKHERKFKPIFNFVFRDTLVVDNIQTARRLMDGRRLVTLEGDIVEKSGAMSGGSIERKKGMLVSKELLEKEKGLMEELTVLNSRKADIIRGLRMHEERRKEIQSEVDGLNASIGELNKEISLLNSLIEDARARLASMDYRKTEKYAERDEIYGEMSKIEGEVEEIESKIKNLSDEISEIEKKLKGSEIPRLTSELERFREELSRNKEALLSVEKRIENAEYRKSQVQSYIEEKELQISRIEEEKLNMLSKIEEDKARLAGLREKLEKLKEREKEVGKAVKGLREKRDSTFEELRKLEQQKSNAYFQIKTIDERIKARQETLQNVGIELQGIEEFEVEELPPLESITKRLEEIEAELASFGDVNLKAIQEYKEVKSRRDELLKRKLTLEKERREVLRRIEGYEQMKRDAFFTAFNGINCNFVEIIRELTEGDGELYLDDVANPFNSGLHIRVKPYNKPLQRLESMSGGEKSLVALALIFAIQQFKPAPFYAFDEVDMFLDGVNVDKVAKMIRKRSEDAQFIVVSLRKPMLEAADSIIGVTLRRDNSSLVTGIRMKARV
jgi:chromosome segregation protein